MNSNNSFDRYKIAKYYLFADIFLIFVSLVILCIFGFKVSTTQSSYLLFDSVLSIIISLVVITVYVGFRYDWAKSFANLVIVCHNVLFSTALICLLRIPVAETLIMSYVLLVGLSTVFSLILFEKVGKIDYKKTDLNITIKNSLKDSVKMISIFSIVVISVVLLCMLFANNSIYNFAREFFVMMIVMLYAVLVLNLPIYFYFVQRIRTRKKAKVDTSVENQKVVKAVNQEETNEQDVKEENLVDNA